MIRRRQQAAARERAACVGVEVQTAKINSLVSLFTTTSSLRGATHRHLEGRERVCPQRPHQDRRHAPTTAALEDARFLVRRACPDRRSPSPSPPWLTASFRRSVVFFYLCARGTSPSDPSSRTGTQRDACVVGRRDLTRSFLDSGVVL